MNDVAVHFRLVLAVRPGAESADLGIKDRAEMVVDHAVVDAHAFAAATSACAAAAAVRAAVAARSRAASVAAAVREGA